MLHLATSPILFVVLASILLPAASSPDGAPFGSGSAGEPAIGAVPERTSPARVAGSDGLFQKRRARGEPPAWVDSRTLPDTCPDCYQGVGSARIKGDDVSAARGTAETAARAALAAEVRVRIRSRAGRYVSSGRQELSSRGETEMFLDQFTQDTHAEIDELLSGIRIERSWVDPENKVSWVQAVLDPDDLAKGAERLAQLWEIRATTLDDAFREALNGLPKSVFPAGSKVVVYRFSYVSPKNSAGSGGTYLGQVAEAALASVPGIQQVLAGDIERRMSEDDRLEFWEVASEETARVVQGTWFDDGKLATVFVRVVDSSSRELLGVRVIRVASGVLQGDPPELKAQAAEAFAPVLDPDEQGGLQIEIYPNRGAGATYRYGDRMFVAVDANQDCFIRIYVVPEQGAAYQLFPNPRDLDNLVRAGRSKMLGIPGGTFSLSIGPPPGHETLKVVACASQFTDHGAQVAELRMRFDQGRPDDLLVKEPGQALRDFFRRGVPPGALLAEDAAVYGVAER